MKKSLFAFMAALLLTGLVCAQNPPPPPAPPDTQDISAAPSEPPPHAFRDRDDDGRRRHFEFRPPGLQGNGTNVPIALFICGMLAILGTRYFRERTEQKRMEVLKAMVEKGQPIPEALMNSFTNQKDIRRPHWRHQGHSLRRGIMATIIGGSFLVYHFMSEDGYGRGFVIAGIILLGVGIGHLATYKSFKDDSNK